jgi:hypothetical protein
VHLNPHLSPVLINACSCGSTLACDMVNKLNISLDENMRHDIVRTSMKVAAWAHKAGHVS